ncbi:MAG: GNAT family N-acetyltransferase [Brevinematales bacterium]|nr:GNAT family N-acetyltransferase [Brevinematales bacterium]
MPEIIEIKMAKSIDAVSDLRAGRLAQLSEPQEYYLEELVANSKTFIILEDGTITGYALVEGGSHLVEFYYSETEIFSRKNIFQRVIQELKIKKAGCQSFDHSLLSTAMFLKPKVEATGILFRRFDPYKYWNTSPKGLEYSIASKRDYDQLRGINDGFFSSDAEIRDLIAKKYLTVFYSDKRMIGCGNMMQAIPGINAYDIGIMVAPVFRRQGYGAYIAYRMASECIAAGRRPVAGCSIENTASIKALENAGFISHYRWMELHF